MSRPLNKDIVQGKESWDSDLRDDLKQLYKTPVPLPNGTYELADGSTEGSPYTGSGDLPSANQHDGCVAAIDHTTRGWVPFFSDGTSWKELSLRTGADINVLTDNSGGTSGGDTIVGPLANISDVQDAVATLAEKINDIITELGLDL